MGTTLYENKPGIEAVPGKKFLEKWNWRFKPGQSFKFVLLLVLIKSVVLNLLLLLLCTMSTVSMSRVKRICVFEHSVKTNCNCAYPATRAWDLAFCLKVPLDSLLVWASSGGSGKTAWMRRLAWTFAAHIGNKDQIRLTQPVWWSSAVSVVAESWILFESEI